MQVQAYLDFDGRCEEALEFYKQALGAQVDMLMRLKEAPQQPPPGMVAPGSDNKIMHVTFRIGDTTVMASDGACKGQRTFSGITLSIQAKDVPEAERAFNALSAGGRVNMPLQKTFFSPAFGMLADKFGVSWMVNVPGQI